MASASSGTVQATTHTVSMEQVHNHSPVTGVPLHSQAQSLSDLPALHKSQRPFQCGLCSVTFDINMELVTHVHRHSTIKPFQCGFCKVSYENNVELTVHVKTHMMFTFHVPSEPVSASAYLSVSSCLHQDQPPAEWKAQAQETNFHDNALYQAEHSAIREKAQTDLDTITASTETKPAASTVQHIGSEMVVENPWPWHGKEKIKPEVPSDDEMVESDQCAEPEIKTEGDVESVRKRAKLAKKRQVSKRSKEKPFHCDICDASFKAARYVKDHKRRVHKLSLAQSCRRSGRTRIATNRDSGPAVLETAQSEPDEESSDASNDSEEKAVADDLFEDDMTTATQKTTRPSSWSNSKMQFECSVCGKFLKNRDSLRKHEDIVHSDNRPFPCTRCSLRFKTKKTMKDHVSFVHNDERRFPCSHCPARLKTKVQLSNHVRSKHTNERPYQCEHCSDRFNLKGTLTKHILSKHSEDADVSNGNNAGERPHQCVYCSAQFKLKGTLSAHILIKHSDIDSATDDRPCACPHCPRRFKEKFSLGSHIARVHDNRRPFPCPHCATRFKSKSELSNHVSRKHNTETPYQCADCGKCFKIKKDLNQHFCKPRDCPICQLSLNCQSSYENHMRRKHSTENFPCTTCQRSFPTRRELEVHTRTHTNEKPYTCEFCGQSFAMLTYLTYHRNGRHLNTRPFKCNICQKGFNSHPSLWQHKRRHLGDKRYACTQCDKTFYTSGSLKQHALTHTDLRLHACPECGKTYRSRSNMTYHWKHAHQL